MKYLFFKWKTPVDSGCSVVATEEDIEDLPLLFVVANMLSDPPGCAEKDVCIGDMKEIKKEEFDKFG